MKIDDLPTELREQAAKIAEYWWARGRQKIHWRVEVDKGLHLRSDMLNGQPRKG